MATPSPTPSPGHSLNPPYQTSGDRFDDKYHMSTPVLAASATRVVMATDEGHVGFGSDPREDDEENESAPLAFVWKTEPFLRPHHEQQRVCAHKITMCGEHLYAYSLERRTHVCIHHVDATKPYPLAVGSVVECLAGAADKLVVGTKRGFVVCYQLAAISAGLGRLPNPSPELYRLEIPSYRLEVSQQKITGLCFTPDASGFFTVDGARQLRLWAYRPAAPAEDASGPSGGTADPTLKLKPVSLLTEVGEPDWPSALAAITAVEPNFIVTSPDDLRAGASRAPRLAPRNPRPAPRGPLSPPPPRLPYPSQAAWRATKISSSQASASPTSSSSIGGETAAQICSTCFSSLSASGSALRRARILMGLRSRGAGLTSR